ncbi:MAG TPA: type IX secretion system sortase PorU [Candidatus Kapabacteria bacterium]|nr:type IX secretion system sortase PorU [Candidatus Kapabacteria bacterium]
MIIRNVIQTSILLIFIILTSVSSFASNAEIITSNESQFSFKLQFPNPTYNTINIDGNNFSQPHIDNCILVSSPGEPYKLAYKFIINIPDNQIPQLLVNQSEFSLQYTKLAPTPEKLYLNNNIDLKYTLDNKYNNDYSASTINNDIQKFISIDYKGIAGDKYIAEITISPYLFSSKQNQLKLLKNVIATIIFKQTKNPIKNIKNKHNNYNYANALNYYDTPNWSIFNDNAPKLLSQEKSMAELSSGNWLKLEINQNGIYQISADDLKSLGYNLSNEEVKTIKIFGIGGKPLSENVDSANSLTMNEQEIIVNTNPDGSLQNIVFFGSGASGFELRNKAIRRFNNYYNSKISYMLTWGGTDGKRAVASKVPSGEVINNPNTYIDRYLFEEDLTNPYQPGAGRVWFGRSFFNVPFSPVLLHNLDRSGLITYRFSLAHHSFMDRVNNNSGEFTIYENNAELGKLVIAPTGKYEAARIGYFEVQKPASIINGDNRSIIKMEYKNSKDMSATSYFDYMEIHYPRSLIAVDNTINLIPELEQSGITQYNFNGFSGQIYGFDISNLAYPKLLQNNASTGGMFILKTDLQANTFQNYFLSSNLQKPVISKVEMANLRDNNDSADIVIITHLDLLQSALKYKEYRESEGYKVSIFRTDHIYNEFASGNSDITAIRNFLSFLKMKWNGKPDYVILWGDGHYDFRNISTNKTNYIPAYQTYHPDTIELSEITDGYATDDFYADLLGNDNYFDIRIGRITIDKPDIGDDIVDKIKNYENNLSEDQFRTNILMVADDGPTTNDYDGSLHTASSERLQTDVISVAAPELQYDKIYMVEYPSVIASGGRRKPQVTEDLLTKINTSGALIVNWFGHGNPRVWAHENILERDITIPKMINQNKPFFLTAATCDFGRFDNPEVRSGAEEMFISKNGGAIGAFSATRVVYAGENESLAKTFFKILLTKDEKSGQYPTLGDAMLKVKLSKYSENDRKYFLLGDPLIRLAIPDFEIKIEEINGQDISKIDSTISLKAMSEVTIKGAIYDRFGQNIQTDFNGIVSLTLRDGDKQISMYEVVDGTQRSLFFFNKLGSSLNQSSYQVENGKFIAKFLIPKDISFSDSSAKLFTYAYSNNKQYAKGFYNNIKITGFDNTNSVRDTIGPEITISFDSRKFIDGDIVSNNPLLILDLYDESGINTTGLGIGHRLEAWIDNSQTSIDLTNYYVSSMIDAKSGTVNKVLYGLSDGEHNIKIRVWDIFNNFSIKESKFRINKNSVYLDELLAYPNPFESATNIKFRHTSNIPTKANIEIYTINGQLIRFLQSDINTNFESEVNWDGNDNFGNQVPIGVYIFKVELPNINSDKIVKFGKVVKIK